MVKQMMEYNHAILVTILESIMKSIRNKVGKKEIPLTSTVSENTDPKLGEILNLRRDLLMEWAEIY